ncbi:hypothetical protein BH10BDE1_BH10BDE1_01210 [soil metagenome]
MSNRTAPGFVTLMLVCALTALAVASPENAVAAIYKVALMQKSKVLSTRTIDTGKAPQAGVTAHAGNGLTFEVQDTLASCNVFVQASSGLKADVMVSIIENGATAVVTNSALLTKEKIEPKDQTVYPGAEGTREVTVNAPKLNRTCTVSVL